MSRVIIIYWIYTANNCGMLFSWGVSVCPSGTGLGNEHFLRYVFVLDIYCQQLWNVVQLRGDCVPFGHRVRECTFSEMCICIGCR